MKVQSPAMKKVPLAARCSVAVLIFSFLSAPVVSDTARSAHRIVADVRAVRHCHNTPRRVYCHTGENLPLTIRSSDTVKT
jgi:hypothetical protein